MAPPAGVRTCPGCGEGEDLLGDHAVCCPNNNSRKRHDNVATMVAQIVQTSGITVAREVACPIQPGDMLDGVQRPRPADVMASMGATGRVAVDIAVVHPLIPSDSHTPASAKRAIPTAEKAKVRRYGDITARALWEFIPFVCSTYGAVGTEARGFLVRVTAFREAAHSTQSQVELRRVSPADGDREGDILSLMMQQVSVAVAKGVTLQLLQKFSPRLEFDETGCNQSD